MSRSISLVTTQIANEMAQTLVNRPVKAHGLKKFCKIVGFLTTYWSINAESIQLLIYVVVIV